jgi:hypothetical protein
VLRFAVLVLAACGAPPPQPISSVAPPRPRAIVIVPAVDRELLAIEGPLLVDHLGKLYLVRGDRSTAVEIPEHTKPIALADLERVLKHEKTRIAREDIQYPPADPALVVMAASTPASRVGEVGDALAAAGYCFVPVVSYEGRLGTFVARCAGRDDHHSVNISLFATRAQLWIGVTRIAELEMIAHRAGAVDRDAVAGLVGKWKHMAFFAERDDIDLVGAPDVTYGMLVEIGSVTARTGFSAIRIVSPKEASIVPKL